MRNKELGVRNYGNLFTEKLLSDKSIAQQCKPTLFTIHSSLFTKKRLGSFL